MNDDIIELIKDGKVLGFSSLPKNCETVISRVFIFDKEDIVLKIYKRDNLWWNQDMEDLSRGVSRTDFITQDFNFNNFLNPNIYISLKVAKIINGNVELAEPEINDDELVIIMKKTDLSDTLTKALYKNYLTTKDFIRIGKSFAEIKLAIPKNFTPTMTFSWHEQILNRTAGLTSWVMSVIPKDTAKKGLATYESLLKKNDNHIRSVTKDKLSALIDCNSENLLYFDQTLRIVDAYPPKLEWRRGTLDVDLFRVGSDIRALAGEDAYQAYLTGVKEVVGSRMDDQLRDFHLLYAALISVGYYFMLGSNDSTYKPVANRYLKYLQELISR